VILIFSGTIGRCGVGGLAWMSMQYLAGLRALGHEVYYLEECGAESWVYDWETEQLTTDLAYPAAYVRECLRPLGLDDHWIYRAGELSEGMAVDDFREVCARADLLLVHAVPVSWWREEYAWPRRRVFIDVDPGFTQMSLASGDSDLGGTVARCERLFTIGQRIGAADCSIPTAGRTWLTTRPPVALPHWPEAQGGPATHFTCVMQWRGFRDVQYGGKVYGQKDREFPRFLDLPRRTSQPLRIALGGAPPEQLTPHGWEVVPGGLASRTPASYQAFIQQSRAEFGVAKHGYVQMRGGWFSDRSVCYLASGRPVLVQDTALAGWLPTGEGVVTFRDLSEAVAGIDRINGDYEHHRRAARQVAEEFFAAERVLPGLLTAALD
jgi:hypothetical protein